MQANLELVGEKWWRPSMGRREGGGIPELELVLMGWVFGSSLVRNGIISLVILD
jgi:hypothetical protein